MLKELNVRESRDSGKKNEAMFLISHFFLDGDAFIEGDKMGLFTTSYQLIAEKPRV